MKKTILALVLALSVLAGIACFIVPASAARLAPYLKQYEEVAKPADADRILMPNNSIAIWWGQETIYGEWSMHSGYTDENRFFDGAGSACWMDNDMKTALFRFGLPTTATQFVVADSFTAYGAGKYGYSKMQPSDWERFTLAGSMDGNNWFPIEFTIQYHLEPGRVFYGTHAASLEDPADLWWHLVFTEPVELEYLAFHTSNPASQDDASYELCFPMDTQHVYLLNGASSAPGTEAPETEAPATDAPVVTPPTGDRVNNVSSDIMFLNMFDQPYYDPTLDSFKSIMSGDLAGWDGNQFLNDGGNFYAFTLVYQDAVLINEVKVKAIQLGSGATLPHELAKNYVYAMGESEWVRCNATVTVGADNYITFTLDEAVTTDYIMLVADAGLVPSGIRYYWRDFSSAYVAPVETEAPATDAPATDAPATDAPTADGSETDAVTEAPATTEGAADSEGTPVWIWIVIGVAVVAVVVVVVILGKKRK